VHLDRGHVGGEERLVGFSALSDEGILDDLGSDPDAAAP